MAPFVETQTFRSSSLGRVGMLLGAIPGLIGVVMLIAARSAPSRVTGGSLIVVSVTVAVSFLVPWLRVEVQGATLTYRFFPFHGKPRIVDLRDVRAARAVTYRPIRDYGGWGIRIGAKGWAYNVSGDRGVELELRDGTLLLIGSQRPEELAAAIESGRPGG
ncbi:MAG TPA: hypothetical protein VF139_17125 [Candidatus Polarisedimenticolaceae bacterium]